jgi:hypothetical protein
MVVTSYLLQVLGRSLFAICSRPTTEHRLSLFLSISMAIVQTVWAVLLNDSNNMLQNELIPLWEDGLQGKSKDPHGIHGTIRSIGDLCAFVPPTNPLDKVLQRLFHPTPTFLGCWSECRPCHRYWPPLPVKRLDKPCNGCLKNRATIEYWLRDSMPSVGR